MKQSGCRETLYFSHGRMDIPPQCLQQQYFDQPFTRMWFLVSSFILLATFPGNASDFAGLSDSKIARIVMVTSVWNSNIPIFCFCTVGKRFHVYGPCKERPPPLLWSNANSVCGHKLIEQISLTYFLVAGLKGFWN